MTAGRSPVPRPDRGRRLEFAVLAAILVLAALTRLPGLAERGRWDADQGTDMRVLRALAIDGEIPLLGPRTSIGTFHHGAAYYYLLAPAAVASAADPVAVTGWIALFGIAAVAGTWWLARLVGGPLAAALAGLLAAISPAGIDESTFIWNPNLIPPAAALAYAATIRARQAGSARWWLAAGVGAMVTMQCHVLGVVIVLPLLWAWASDAAARRRARLPMGGVGLGGLGAALVVAAGYLPLLVYELGHGFAETRAILSYVGEGGGEAAGGLLDRVLFVGLRSITWPLAGLVTDRIWTSLAVAVAILGLGAIAVVARTHGRAGAQAGADDGASAGGDAVRSTGHPARWLAGTLGVVVVMLAAFAPSLAVVVPELPNDHYHAFLDPLVLALAAAGLARLATTAPGGRPGRAGAWVLAIALTAVAMSAWPPPRAPDGGWPLADSSAARVLAAAGQAGPIALDGIPPFKNDNALRFPLERRGADLLPATPEGSMPSADAPVVVLVCDPLFEGVVGAACGGPAEADWLRAAGQVAPELVERIDAGPRRVISVFAAPARQARTPAPADRRSLSPRPGPGGRPGSVP